MKGYTSMNQYVKDYSLYLAARRVDPKTEGETITSILKKRISSRLASAGKGFRQMVKKRGYCDLDLRIIGTHDSVAKFENFEHFVKMCFSTQYASPSHFRTVLKSMAFRSGRLKKLYDIIPLRIGTKKEFNLFMKNQYRYIGISDSELRIIMNSVSTNEWRGWLIELEKSGTVQLKNGRWVL